MSIDYKKANIADAPLLIKLYNAAFYNDYCKYGECPAYGHSKEDMEESIVQSPKYIILHNSTPVGVFSFQDQGNGDYYIGCLCVFPEYQGKGIGTHAFVHLQAICSDWKKITLITPVDKVENIKFYTEKCGFKIGNVEMDGSIEVIGFYKER